MFGLGKSNPKAKLEKQYKKLLEESYRLSTTDRAKSDKVRAEAEEVIKQIEELENSKK